MRRATRKTTGHPRAHGFYGLCLCVLVSLLGTLTLVDTASAGEVHVYSKSFGAGELALGEHSGVAVDQGSGEVYVADTGNSRIARFSADGTADGTLAAIPAPTFIAVDNASSSPSESDVYVVDSADESIEKLDASGVPVAAWGTAGRKEGFGTIAGIAVDSSGGLWVANTEAVLRHFDPAGTEDGGFTAELGGAHLFFSPAGIAVDPSDALYVVSDSHRAQKFSAQGKELAFTFGGGGYVEALAIADESEDVYLGVHGDANPQTAEIERFTTSESLVERFGEFTASSEALLSGIADDPGGGDFYVGEIETNSIALFSLVDIEEPTVTVGAPSMVGSTSAHLSGTVNPNGSATSCEFQLVPDAAFNRSGFTNDVTHAICDTDPGSGANAVPVEADAEGLQPGTTYHVRLVATNRGGSGYSVEPGPTLTTEPIAPSIEGASVISADLTEVLLSGSIDPGGAATTYHFEYIDEASYLSYGGFFGPTLRSTPESGPLPGDNTDHEVRATVSGLTAGTPYRFRVVASNVAGRGVGPEPAPSFTTQASPLMPSGGCPNEPLRDGFGAALPDCRAFEQASPVDKGGVYLEGFPDLVLAAADGSGVTNLSGSGTGYPITGGGRQDSATVLSSLTAGSWSTQSLLPPEQLGRKARFLGASSNLRFSLVEAGTENLEALFLVDTRDGSTTQIGAYHGTESALGGRFGEDSLDGIADDGSWLFFGSAAKLTPDAAVNRSNLYRWDRTTDAVTLAGILPAAEKGIEPSGGAFGGAYEWYRENTSAGGAGADMYVEAIDAMPADGSQIYFTAGNTGQLYLRRGLDGPDPNTVRVSKPNQGVEDPHIIEEVGEDLPAAFLGATPDGAHAFFMSQEKFTADAATGPFDEGSDLYRYDVSADRLVDITADVQDSVDAYGAPVRGATVKGLLGVSEDGRSGYLAARGVLAEGGVPGEDNVYRFEEGAPGQFRFKFLASEEPTSPCSAAFAANWGASTYCGSGIAEYQGKLSRVTPDAESLLYTRSGELYLYRAAADRSICISCNPSGAQSAGSSELTAGFFNANSFAIPRGLAPAAHLTRNLSDDGSRVFFQTPDSLVADDHNGPPNCSYLFTNGSIKRFPSCEDVYEWEAPSVQGNSCQKVEVNGGCLYLLSGGQSPEASYFLDASADGNSVFVASTSQFVPIDRDDLYDVYDARVDGGLPSQHVIPGSPCQGESCRGSAAPAPSTSSAGSSALAGSANVVPRKARRCRRHARRCHGHRRHAHRKHRRRHGRHRGHHHPANKGGKK